MNFDTLLSLYHSGAYIPLAIVLAFYTTRFTGAHVKRPNIAHWLAIATGVLALFLPSALQGQTPNLQMIVAAVVPAITLLAPGLVPAQPKVVA